MLDLYLSNKTVEQQDDLALIRQLNLKKCSKSDNLQANKLSETFKPLSKNSMLSQVTQVEDELEEQELIDNPYSHIDSQDQIFVNYTDDLLNHSSNQEENCYVHYQLSDNEAVRLKISTQFPSPRFSDCSAASFDSFSNNYLDLSDIKTLQQKYREDQENELNKNSNQIRKIHEQNTSIKLNYLSNLQQSGNQKQMTSAKICEYQNFNEAQKVY
eukprot:403349687